MVNFAPSHFLRAGGGARGYIIIVAAHVETIARFEPLSLLAHVSNVTFTSSALPSPPSHPRSAWPLDGDA